MSAPLLCACLALVACPGRPAAVYGLTTTASSSALLGGQTAQISAALTVQTPGLGAPAPASNSTVKFSVDQGGTIAPASAIAGSGTGIADAVFTAALVDHDLKATVTAKSEGVVSSTVIAVSPQTITGLFAPATTIAGDNVDVATSVIPFGTGWKWIYTITPGPGASPINAIELSMQVPGTATISRGVIQPLVVAAAPSARWGATGMSPASAPASVTSSPITITVTGTDIVPGGAVTWQITTKSPNLIQHTTLTTTGPK